MNQELKQAKVAEALECHALNYNCAQCVACVLAELAGTDRQQAFLYMEGFGAGMGGHTETCGALSGLVMSLSAVCSDGIESRTTKVSTYEKIAPVVQTFKERYGTTICAELRPAEPERVREVCEGYISGAVEMGIDYLEQLKA